VSVGSDRRAPPGQVCPGDALDLLLPSSPGDPGGRGVYVHLPFCLVRCPYCDFNAYAGMDDLKRPYLEALLAEIREAADGGRVATVFFGGGTPTELPAPALARILAEVRDGFSLDSGAEVTIEANPETVSEEAFEALLGAGFNRVSVGVQSLVPQVLTTLGRVHGAERALAALREATSTGFEHVSADLIFGTPGESPEDWRRSLEGVLEAGVDHVSAYALTVEEKTPLAAWVAQGRVPAPDEDDQADKYELAAEVLSGAGLARYEISNWARPGCWSRHNVGYWVAGDYLGFGAGAHSHRVGRRWWNVSLPRTYIARSPAVEEGHEELSEDQRLAEAAFLGLRLAGGIRRRAFEARFGVDPVARYAGELARAVDLGLVEVTPERLRLSTKGSFFWSSVARALVNA
jgi:putative oxygen-independent coproporphyrinogen III oxidase